MGPGVCRGKWRARVEVSQGESLAGRFRRAADLSSALHRCLSGILGGLGSRSPFPGSTPR